MNKNKRQVTEDSDFFSQRVQIDSLSSLYLWIDTLIFILLFIIVLNCSSCLKRELLIFLADFMLFCSVIFKLCYCQNFIASNVSLYFSSSCITSLFFCSQVVILIIHIRLCSPVFCPSFVIHVPVIVMKVLRYGNVSVPPNPPIFIFRIFLSSSFCVVFVSISSSYFHHFIPEFTQFPF